MGASTAGGRTERDDVDDLHAQVADRLDADAFGARVAAVRDEFGDLLDDRAAAMLLVAREGRLEVDEAALVPGRMVTVEGVVQAVHDLRTFQRSDGSRGRVLNVDVKPADDGRGPVRVVFWDDDADAWADLRSGSRVRLEGGRVKDGRYGTEVHLGRGGRFERVGAGPPEATGAPDGPSRGAAGQAGATWRDPDDPPGVTRGKDTIPGLERRTPGRSERLDLAGVLRDRQATRTFQRKDGGTGFVTTVVVEEAGGGSGGSGDATGATREVTLWDDACRDVQRVPVGARVALRDLVERGGELHSTDGTEVLAPDGLAGPGGDGGGGGAGGDPAGRGARGAGAGADRRGATTLDRFLDG